MSLIINLQCDKAVIKPEHDVMDEKEKIYQYNDERRVISEANLVKGFLNNIKWDKQQRPYAQIHETLKEIYIILHS